MKYTAAHWGSYRVDDKKEEIQLKPLETDPDPSVIGTGWLSATIDSKVRIKRPAIRKGWLDNRNGIGRCNDKYVEVPWDQALDLVAEELNRVIDTRGNSGIFAGSYGWASAGRFHHAQSQLRRFMNIIGGYVGSTETYSHAAAEILLPHITGMSNGKFQDEMTNWPDIAEHCELLLCFGGISGRTAQVSSSGTSSHIVDHWLKKAKKKGVEMVNISPLKSDLSAELQAQWVSIRPGTDTALILALAHTLLSEKLYDRNFLSRYCVGWEIFSSYLEGKQDGIAKTPEWASEICDISPTTIRTLARKLTKKKTMITVVWGLQRSDHGEQPLWAALALACMVGQMGKPGTGFGFGYGSTTSVGRPEKLHRWPSLNQGQNPISDKIPVARIADMLLNPGGEYQFNGEHRHYPDIDLIYWCGGNPFHHHQDLFRLEEAWEKPRTVIVHEPFWTATARRADIVLPVTSPMERNDIMMNKRDTSLIWMSKLFEPFGESRNDHDIFCDLASRFGVREKFSENLSEDQWLEKLWDDAKVTARNTGFDLPDFDKFKQAGLFQCPESEEWRVQFSNFIENPEENPLNTPSGKIEIFSETIAEMKLDDCPGSPTWIEPIEWLGMNGLPGNAFHLLSIQPLTRLHSQLDNGSTSRKSKLKEREVATLNTKAAARLGLVEGDIILLSSPRGKCLAGLSLTDHIREDLLILPTGAWFDPQVIDGEKIDVHGNPNAVTIDKGCSKLSQGTIAHTTVVTISKWEKELPELIVTRAPVIGL